MTRHAAALLVALAVLAGVLVPGPAAAEEHGGEVDKVLVITAPALRWADLAGSTPELPNIESFVSGATTALMSLRTIGARTNLGESYVTISAGNRGSARRTIAGLALQPDEPFEAGTAAAAYERRTGAAPTGEVLHLGWPSVEQTNDRFRYGAEPGALGEILVEAGRAVGVVANGDAGLAVVTTPDPAEEDSDAKGGETQIVGDDTASATDEVVDADDEESALFGEGDFGRAAALAVVDSSGQVPVGRTDGLLLVDDAAPYGVRYDPDAVVDAFTDVWARADVAVVELSDLDRADRYRREADPEAAQLLWEDALVRSDELMGDLVDEVDLSTTMVMLVTPSAPRAAESLGVFAMAGAGTDGTGGLAQSGTTRRPGYVTLPDVAPTILHALGIDAPSSMTGTIIAETADVTVDQERFEIFADATERAVFRDRATGPVSVVFVIVQILAYALAGVAVARRRGWTVPVSFLALVVLATPFVGFLAGSLEVDDADLVTYTSGIFATAAVLAGLAEGAGRLVAHRWPRTRGVVAPLLLTSLTWLLLVYDVITGGRLQIDTVFGYSPIVAGRFAGFGNLAFALIAATAVVVVCGWWAVWRLSRGPADGEVRLRGPAALVVAAFLGLTVVIDGAPAWGSDVGGVLALVPGFTVLVLVGMGVAISWRRGLLIGAATGLVLAVFAALDLARPEEDRTHLGRLVDRVLDPDGGGLADVISRKLQTNLNILTSSIWTLTIPFALGLVIYLARRRTGPLRDLQDRVPGTKALLAGGLLIAALGFALNDSGVAVPAMMFAVLLPYLTYVLLRWAPAQP
jgi:hypothetical protein